MVEPLINKFSHPVVELVLNRCVIVEASSHGQGHLLVDKPIVKPLLSTTILMVLSIDYSIVIGIPQIPNLHMLVGQSAHCAIAVHTLDSVA